MPIATPTALARGGDVLYVLDERGFGDSHRVAQTDRFASGDWEIAHCAFQCAGKRVVHWEKIRGLFPTKRGAAVRQPKQPTGTVRAFLLMDNARAEPECNNRNNGGVNGGGDGFTTTANLTEVSS